MIRLILIALFVLSTTAEAATRRGEAAGQHCRRQMAELLEMRIGTQVGIFTGELSRSEADFLLGAQDTNFDSTASFCVGLPTIQMYSHLDANDVSRNGGGFVFTQLARGVRRLGTNRRANERAIAEAAAEVIDLYDAKTDFFLMRAQQARSNYSRAADYEQYLHELVDWLNANDAHGVER